MNKKYKNKLKKYNKINDYYNSLKKGVYINNNEFNSILKRKLLKGLITQQEFDKQFKHNEPISTYKVKGLTKKRQYLTQH